VETDSTVCYLDDIVTIKGDASCDEPRVQSTLKGFTEGIQRLQRLGEAKGFTTSACGASVSIAKDVQWW